MKYFGAFVVWLSANVCMASGLYAYPLGGIASGVSSYQCLRKDPNGFVEMAEDIKHNLVDCNPLIQPFLGWKKPTAAPRGATTFKYECHKFGNQQMVQLEVSPDRTRERPYRIVMYNDPNNRNRLVMDLQGAGFFDGEDEKNGILVTDRQGKPEQVLKKTGFKKKDDGTMDVTLKQIPFNLRDARMVQTVASFYSLCLSELGENSEPPVGKLAPPLAQPSRTQPSAAKTVPFRR